MSTIYDLDIKGMRKALQSFGKTIYGTTVFTVAYFIPLTTFVAIITDTVLSLLNPEKGSINSIVALIAVFVLSFIAGTAYYYKELKDYIREKHK